MNKKLYVFLFGMLLITGCSFNGLKTSENSKSHIEVDIMESEVKNDSADVAEKQDFLVDFYKKYIVEEGDDVRSVDLETILGFMTEQAKKNLLDAYDMDCPTNDCMAVWLFYGQGFDDQVKNVNITPDNEKDFFCVDLQYKGGYSYKAKIGIVRQKGKPMINSVKAL